MTIYFLVDQSLVNSGKWQGFKKQKKRVIYFLDQGCHLVEVIVGYVDVFNESNKLYHFTELMHIQFNLLSARSRGLVVKAGDS